MSESQASWRELLTGKNGVWAMALSIGITLHAVNTYLSATILPTAVKEIGGIELYAWNTTLFIVTAIFGAAWAGQLLSQKGSRFAYGIAAGFMFLGSGVAFVAPSMPIMLLGRALQGLGGGLLMTLAYAMVPQLFRQALWSRAMALLSGMWGVATLLGPAIGGVFAEFGLWREAFGSVLPITLLYGIFTIKVLPVNVKELTHHPLAWLQISCLTLAVLVLSFVSLLDQVAWHIAGGGTAIALFILMVRQDKRSPVRLMPKGSFKLGTSMNLILVTMAMLIFVVTLEAFLPFFLQSLHGMTPFYAGLMAAAMAAGWAISELYSAKWSGKQSLRAIAAGPMLVLVGLVGLSYYLPLVAPAVGMVTNILGVLLALVGFGIGLGWPHLSAQVFMCVDEDEQDMAASAMTSLQMFAGAIAAALFGLIANVQGMAETLEGTSATSFGMLLTGALAAALSLIAAFSLTKKIAF